MKKLLTVALPPSKFAPSRRQQVKNKNHVESLITISSQEQEREKERKETLDFTGRLILAGLSMQHTFKPWHINKNKRIH